MGLIFKIFQGSHSEPRKNSKKSLKMGTFFQKKTLNMGTFWGKKLPLNMGMGSELSAAHPRPIQI